MTVFFSNGGIQSHAAKRVYIDIEHFVSKLSNVEEIRNLLGYVISCFHLVLVSLLLLLLLLVLYYQSMVNKHYLNVWLYLGLSSYAGMCPTSP